MGVLDDLDGASEAEIQRLMGSVVGARGPRVSLPDERPVKLGKKTRKIVRGPWEPQFQNINETVKIEIELPLYMVVAMGGLDYREAVRDYLKKVGRGSWAESRFLRGSEATMMRARDLFTRTFRG